MLQALASGHNSLVGEAKPNQLLDVGTTTLIAGIVLPLANPDPDGKWIFVCISIGDCKVPRKTLDLILQAYHWSSRKKKTTDITTGNRRNISDVRYDFISIGVTATGIQEGD